MTFQEFVRYHMPALEADEVRFNVQIAVMAAAKDFPAGFQYWTLGAPGHCAFRSPDRSILLAELDRNECQRLARETKNVSYPGVLERDDTAVWFAEEASLSGITFQAIEQQRIHAHRISLVSRGGSRCALSHRCGRATAFRMDDRVSPRSYSLRSTAAMGES